MYTCIFTHPNEHSILREEQHGFQAGKSCETQLTMTIDDFANCLNDNSQIDCIYFLIFPKRLTGYHKQTLQQIVLLWN